MTAMLLPIRPTIAVLLPIHDPRHWPNALTQYARQQYDGRCLIVVANGFDEYLPGFELATAVYQTPVKLGAASACNVAMRIAKAKTNADRFARFDCDDLYSESYLNEVDWGLRHARIVGKSEFDWIDTTSGECIRVGRGTAGRRGVSSLTGGTLAGYIDEAIPFDTALQEAEDVAWVIEMRMRHALSALSLSPFNYTKQWWGSGHTYSVSFQQHKEIEACR